MASSTHGASHTDPCFQCVYLCSGAVLHLPPHTDLREIKHLAGRVYETYKCVVCKAMLVRVPHNILTKDWIFV
jgi:hypothetical protein